MASLTRWNPSSELFSLNDQMDQLFNEAFGGVATPPTRGSDAPATLPIDIRQTSVFRQVGLPAEVRADEISASFQNGVLTVTVPRAQKAQPKRIPVSTGAPVEPKVIEAQATQS